MTNKNTTSTTTDMLLVMCHKALEEMQGRECSLPVTYNLIKSFIHKWDEIKKQELSILKETLNQLKQ